MNDAEERVAALARYGILDTEPEPGFDDIVLLATRLCETPVALVSLVTTDRQWFKARVGFTASETPLGQSVCAHALRQRDVMVIPDLTLDARTCDNGLVTGPPFIRFYAGAVLETPDGVKLGTLCVIDTAPRPAGLTATQIESLQALARQVMNQMELRRALMQRDRALLAAQQADDEFRRRQTLLSEELHHRLKNVLAVVHGVVAQTLRHSTDFAQARAAATERIAALGRAQELLFARTMDSASLASIVQGTADLYNGVPGVFRVSGPEIEIAPRSALSLSLIFHELATNATKYGALSVEGGGVTVAWDLVDDGAETRLDLWWRERGGPAVAPPARFGFGTSLIERALAGGNVSLAYDPDGLTCRVSAPVARLMER
jgi:two-component sensor histidine kinase